MNVFVYTTLYVQVYVQHVSVTLAVKLSALSENQHFLIVCPLNFQYSLWTDELKLSLFSFDKCEDLCKEDR